MAFIDDIQSRDTALFPIVTFNLLGGSVYKISIKPFTLDSEHYSPLLLSSPSIKESIDLENRKYKISNVSLKISNVEYNGLRFTDTQIPMNTEVLIHWVSPSCTTITQGQEGSCYLAYQGTVRAITHDEKTCNITLEDISQSTLHRDVPVALLGTGDEVPEKYRNKPIPMVYGNVDKSPCIIINELQGDNSEDFVDETTITVDRMPVYEFNSINAFSLHEEGSLYIYDNDQYFNISNIYFKMDFDSPQYEEYIEEGNIKLPHLYTSGGSDSVPDNNMAMGLLEIKKIRRPIKILPIDNPPYTQWEIFDGTGVHYDFIDYFEDLHHAKLHNTDAGILNPINIPALHHAGIICEFEQLGVDYECKSYLSIYIKTQRPSEAPDGSNLSNANVIANAPNPYGDNFTIPEDIFDINDTDTWHTRDNIYATQYAWTYIFPDWNSIDDSNVIQLLSATSTQEQFNISMEYREIALLQHAYIESPLSKSFYVNVKGRTDP